MAMVQIFFIIRQSINNKGFRTTSGAFVYIEFYSFLNAAEYILRYPAKNRDRLFFTTAGTG